MIIQLEPSIFINTAHIVYLSIGKQQNDKASLYVRMVDGNSFTIIQSESEIEEKIKEIIL